MAPQELEYIAEHVKCSNVPLVLIEKLSEDNPLLDHRVSKGYWVIGVIAGDRLCVGKCIELFRIANSNHPSGRIGWFTTSIVTEVTDTQFKTKNSTYKITHYQPGQVL